MISKNVVVLLSQIGPLVAAANLLEDTQKPDDVFDSSRMIALCVIGSTIGALLSVGLFPPEEQELIDACLLPERRAMLESRKTRRTFIKFGSSMLGGIAFTPFGMQWLAIDHTSSRIVGISAGVSLFIVAVIHAAEPKIELLIDAWTSWLANRHKPKD